MKSYHYIIGLLTIFSGLLTACNDDEFLKEVTESSYTYSNAFVVSSQVNDCVSELYWRYRRLHYADSNPDWFLNGNGTDVSDAGRMMNAPTVGKSNFINWSTTYSYTEVIFNGFYELIARANMVLQGAETVTWPNEADKVQAIAQARFFRGYSYLVLASVFGGVPINEQFELSARVDYQRETRTDTYLYAIGELEAAAANLSEHPVAGRVGKGIAYHCLAETWLALACIHNNDATYLDNSINAATEVMKYHSLMKIRFGKRADPASTEKFNGFDAWFPDGNVFFDLFQRGNFDYEEGNTESLWVQQNDFRPLLALNVTVSTGFSEGFGPNLRDLAWKDEYLEEGASGGPWRILTVFDEFNLSLNFSYEVGGRSQARNEPTYHTKKTVWENCGDDIRNSPVNIRRGVRVLDPYHSLQGLVITEETVADYCTSGSVDYFYPIVTKFCPIDDYGYEGLAEGLGNRGRLWSDMYYYRLAETFLLRAEAKLRKNDKTGAAADINEVRGRAQAPLVAEEDVTIDYILDERIRELYGEELRWKTLLRMGGNIPNDRITKHAYWIVDYPTWSGTLGPDFLFPIPQSFIDSNLDAVIEQNPGWK